MVDELTLVIYVEKVIIKPLKMLVNTPLKGILSDGLEEVLSICAPLQEPRGVLNAKRGLKTDILLSDCSERQLLVGTSHTHLGSTMVFGR